MLTSVKDPGVRRALVALTALVAFASAAGSQAGPTPGQQCQAGKNKTAAKYTACRENAEAKLAAGGDPSKYADALDKCEAKFSTAWQKLEDKASAAGASCPGDDTVIKGKTDTYTNTVAALIGGVGSRFHDNGDGTVTDQQTGLQWEKKQSLDGIQNLADPHDADNLYTWSAASPYTAPDGTAFTQFLATLNAPPCFAGHCDWRLPSEEGRSVPFGVTELESILLAPYPCGTSPCIDPIFGPTVADGYWSTTTHADSPVYAWYVHFFIGSLVYTYKQDGLHVRAVRFGS